MKSCFIKHIKRSFTVTLLFATATFSHVTAQAFSRFETKHQEREARHEAQTNYKTLVLMNEIIVPSQNELNLCLATLELNPLYRTDAEAKQSLDNYIFAQRHLLEKVEANKSEDSNAERRRLLYVHWLVLTKLKECKDLLDGPSKTRYIFLVGRQAKTDGRVFEAIAATQIFELLKKICPATLTQLERPACERQIVYRMQIQKSDLLLYLKLLAPGSVASFTFVGHGWSAGLSNGFKDMVVPLDWLPYSKIGVLQWQKDREGAIYSDDMNYVGPIIAKALKPDGTVSFYACDTAADSKSVAQMLAGQLPPTAKVFASSEGMSYKVVPQTEGWSLSLATGDNFNGPQMVMYPEVKNSFKAVAPTPFSYSDNFKELEKNLDNKTGNGKDDITVAILTRIGRKEAWFTWIGPKPDPKRLIVFDNRDRKVVDTLFKAPPPGHKTFEAPVVVDFMSYKAKANQLISQTIGPEKVYLEDLFKRIDDCIADGVSKYYE